MKTWVFAMLQSLIALLGLSAYFFADNIVLATSAAVMVAVLGVIHPLMAARKTRKLEAYRDHQYQKSFDTLDEQIENMLNESIAPPLPHRATVAVILRSRYGQQATELLEQYERVVEAITTGDSKSETLAAQFADDVAGWSVGVYLRGLASLGAGKLGEAHAHFSAAKNLQSSWIAPWLGWAAAAYQQGHFEEIRENHPSVNGVDLLPYDAGDEQSFLELSEDQRDELSERFPDAACSLGNYYAIAQFEQSKEQAAAAQDELKKVA